MNTFTALIQKEGNMYVAKCPEVGTVSQGKTIKEALENLREATELYLEEFPKPKYGKPIFATFEVGEIAKKSPEAIASEKNLAKDWNTKEEDAWEEL